jgi:hypothetical protein
LIVGTHADKLQKQARASVHAQLQQLYPVSNSRRNHIFGHFTLSITPGTIRPLNIGGKKFSSFFGVIFALLCQKSM